MPSASRSLWMLTFQTPPNVPAGAASCMVCSSLSVLFVFLILHNPVDVLLVGGGHALLPTLARAADWVQAGHRVTLIDPHRYLYYSGMVPEYLGGVYQQEEVRIDLTQVAAQAGVDHVQERAATLDPDAQTVTLASGTTLPYDVVALDVGGVNPHRPDGAIPTKPITSVEGLEQQVKTFLRRPGLSLSLAIVGGGAAGIEIALNLLGRCYAAGRMEDVVLTIIEAHDTILPRFPRGMQQYVTDQLRQRGATVHTNTRVTRLENGHLFTDDGVRHEADPVLWATGSVGPDVLRTSGLATDDQGFLQTEPTLRSPEHPRVFAGGDCATVRGLEHLAKVGVHALKHGDVLRTNLDRTLLHLSSAGTPPSADALTTFRPYPAAPLILSTGTAEGLWTAGDRWLRGRPVLRLKHWIDRRWIRTYVPAWHGASWVDLQRPDAPTERRA